jgi:hypothetical protein
MEMPVNGEFRAWLVGLGLVFFGYSPSLSACLPACRRLGRLGRVLLLLIAAAAASMITTTTTTPSVELVMFFLLTFYLTSCYFFFFCCCFAV